MIDALRAKHDPHYQLAGKVERLEKDIPIQLAQLHKTLSKSFGMQRKTLVRVLGLEKRLAELETVEEAVEKIEEEVKDEPLKEPEVVDDISEEPEEEPEEDEIPPGLDDVLDDVRGEKATKKKKKRPPIKAKKKKISAKDLAKGSSIEGVENIKQKRREKIKSIIDSSDQPAKGELSETVRGVSQSSEQPSSPLDGVIGVVNSIAGSVDSIRQTLMDQQKLGQEQASEQRQQQQDKKRGMKEKALEAGGKIMGGAKKVGEKILAPVQSLWTKLMNFLVGVLLGRTVMKLFEWFSDPANKDKISSLFKFLQDWWPVLLATIMAFIPGLLGPGGMIIGTIALLAWGIPKIINIVKSIFSFGKDVDKELKNIDKDARKTGEDIAKNVENDAKKLGDDAPETEDPSKSSTPAELGDVDKSQKDLQNTEQPQGMKEGGPVESKDGGKVEGEKGVDKVPAMLTEGEFVLSKGAVQAYGVDTLAAMNAAAGGTNKPTVKDGKLAYSGGGPVGTGDEREDIKILANMQQTQMKQFFGITNTKAGLIGDFESGFKEQTQEELNEENNAKLPLGLTMTPDGQNIDLGKFAGDKARMIGEMASDPKFADALKERGKEFGFSDMTGAQFKEISNKQGDALQMEINQFIPGTDAYEMAEISSQIDTSNPNKKSSFGNTVQNVQNFATGGLVKNFAGGGFIQNFADGGLVTNSTNSTNTSNSLLVQNFAGGGSVQELQGGGLVEHIKKLKIERKNLNSKRGSDGKLRGDDRKKWKQLSAEINSTQKQIIASKKDTVPAMLTPGEFVMNKASTEKIGVQNLMKMNANVGKGVLGGALGGVLGGAKKLAMKNPLAQMAKGIGNLFGGAKDKLGEMMGGGDEDKIIGIASADIPKGSPLMKSAKPPAGDAIKPPTKSSGSGGGVQVDNSLTQGLNSGTQGSTGTGGGQSIPSFEADVHISHNKLAVLGVRI
jgi:hypothetical protein